MKTKFLMLAALVISAPAQAMTVGVFTAGNTFTFSFPVPGTLTAPTPPSRRTTGSRSQPTTLSTASTATAILSSNTASVPLLFLAREAYSVLLIITPAPSPFP
jgi:hypothetical protein